MVKKRAVIFFTIVVGIVTAIVFIGKLQGVTGRPLQSFAQIDPARGNGRELKQFPEHVTYEFLFRRIQWFIDKQMPDARLSALLQNEYGITADQAERLKQVARSCVAEVNLHDMRSQEIIAQVRARYPNGVVPRGQKPPPPPPELAVMQVARTGMIAQARSVLQTSLGDDSFRHFDQKVKERIKVGGLPQNPVQ